MNLSLYGNTSFLEALNTPISLATDFFNSESWDKWKTNEEAKMKIQAEQIKGLNAVIKAINNLARIR